MTNDHDTDNALKGTTPPYGNKASADALNNDSSKGLSLTADIKCDPTKPSSGEAVLKEEWSSPHASRYPMAGGFDGATRDWNALSRRVWQLSRAMALFLVFAILVGWPLGDYWAHIQSFGTSTGWSLLSAYPPSIMMFAIVVPALVIFSGYVLSRAMTTTHAAEEIAAAARHYVEPDKAALQEVEIVGTVVREQMDVLNEGLDTALIRLAGAEAMIRKHVDAIETAGVAIETQATSAVERVASERSRLIDLTEKLNTQADGFASAITERTQANIDAMDKASVVSDQVEARFDERLGGLEKAANTALGSFKDLLEALGGADENVRSTALALSEATQKTIEASKGSIAASEEAKLAAQQATEQAVSQSLIDESAMANLETVKKAVELSHEKTSKEALSRAREEGSKIAKAMIEAAGADIEKVAKQVSDQNSDKVEKNLARSQEAIEVAHAKQEEVTEAARAKQEELKRIHDDIEKENERLETLISEQKLRADRLADGLASAIEAQTEKLAKIEEKMRADVEDVIYPTAKANNILENIHNTDDKKLSKTIASAHSQSDNGREESGLDDMGPLRVRLGQVSEGEGNDGPAASHGAGVTQQKETLSSSEEKNALEEATIKTQKMVDEEERSKKEKEVLADPVQTPREDLERLSELARDLSERRNGRSGESSNGGESAQPLNMKASSKKRTNPSWKEILAAADNAAPLDLGIPDMGEPARNDLAQDETGSDDYSSRTNDAPLELKAGVMPPVKQFAAARGNSERETSAIQVITRLQQFTLNLDERLYGDLPSALVERFHQYGDRNIFANRLLRLNEVDVKKRIRLESAKDIQFENDIRQFLKEFDGLLEDAAQSSAVDEELREYLSSPLGRIYLLIGEIVGYFA